MNILFIKKKIPLEGQLQKGSWVYKLLGNTKFWTILPEGFLILHLEQVLSPVWLQGKIPIYGNYSVEKYLEHPKSFANLQFFFHRNDHICFWIPERFI